MNNFSKYLVALSSFLLCAGLVHADGEKCDSVKHKPSNVSDRGITFNSVDINHDGGISKSEFDEYYAKHNSKHFKELDANMDNNITPEELLGNHPQKLGQNNGTTHLDKRFYSADANHDGGLDKAEAHHMPMLTTYFDKVDSDKDGKVTRQEYFDAMPLLHRAKQIDSTGKSQTL